MRRSRPPSQIALTLRAVGGLTTAEIAKAFLVPEATMAQRISRAKARSRSEGIASADLTREAIRLTRAVHALRPEPAAYDGELAGLLALMLLTEARRPARTGPNGELVPLAEQDRALWDRAAIAEGPALVEHALAHARIGPFQVQAAIAAVHAEASDAVRTDWPQVVALYALVDRLAPNPMARV